eukprot:Gregarina_sp_Poly_1__1842@NODE_147_length_12810_cov_168_129012_g132_i0_p2_GENE_NODE_147_length_12810_cov_168_129012_g132_i0NODE_147_length_12810_cov_168_129012_g132_i0_p2_ORF_typecomplete_len482_score48_15AFG1_ATPase/PF03969_16/7_5e59AAA_22/PF13401_6/6_1e05IstB_IS21/PF01695_17/0_063IstB_IS21/PF01695_17/12AAA_16/PF13191_6/0_011AAA_PrkA/PF08298_11/0_012TniB/PF05621_11/0_074Bac_DnaA/PF00308_18/0_22Bac_DnaA/PF00308_18/9_2e02NACHT/PF05729_12/0_25NACHT/PF05729_12/1_1e03RNA_helicase/PF00910_22/0_16KAP_
MSLSPSHFQFLPLWRGLRTIPRVQFLKKGTVVRCFQEELKVSKLGASVNAGRNDRSHSVGISLETPFHCRLRNYLNSRGFTVQPEQQKLMDRLQELETRLVANYSSFRDQQTASVFGKWWRDNGRRRNQNLGETKINRGIYIYGPVGQGKSLMMDIFVRSLRDKLRNSGVVVRCHYHHFMLVLHRTLHDLRSGTASSNSLTAELASSSSMRVGEVRQCRQPQSLDPKLGEDEDIMGVLANRFVNEGVYIIAMDELQINNISDALILKRLLTKLMEKGVVLILTTNCPMERLYENGLNHSQFVPFIPILRKYCEEVNLDTSIDLRSVGCEGTAAFPFWHLLSDMSRADAEIRKILARMNIAPDLSLDNHCPIPLFHGRKIVPQFYDPNSQVAGFLFSKLLAENHSSADFIAISQAAHNGIFLYWDIPSLSLPDCGDILRRLIAFVDIIYDEKVPTHFLSSFKPLKSVENYPPIVSVGTFLRI